MFSVVEKRTIKNEDSPESIILYHYERSLLDLIVNICILG